MAKKKTKGHQSFKMSPHRHSQDRVLMYIVSVALVGLAIGYFFRDQVMAVLGVSTSIY